MNAKRRTTVALLGINDDRIRNTFAMVFAGPAKEVARLSDDGKGVDIDVAIIDVDSVGALDRWQAFHAKHPHCQAIALSALSKVIDGFAATLSKPVKVDQLIETLQRVGQHTTAAVTTKEESGRLSHAPSAASLSASAIGNATLPDGMAADEEKTIQTEWLPAMGRTDSMKMSKLPVTSREVDVSTVCGSAEDIDCNDEVQIRKLFMPLEGRLLAVLLNALAEAKQSNQPVALRYKGSTIAIFHPRGRAVAVPVIDVSLQRLSQAVFPDGMLFFEKLPGDSASAPGSMAVHPDVLLWKVAAWTYRGRLPTNLPPNVRVYLRHWPNLTRLLELPDAMRIAALLNEQPMSMGRVAEALQIPQRHVFAFCACAHTIGLLDIAKRAGDRMIESPPPAPPAHGERQFLGRIMHYLKGLMTR